MLPITFKNNYNHFILNYDIEDVITIHYADGKSEICDYSKETELEILDMMKKQVIQSVEFEYINSADVISYRLYAFINFFLGISTNIYPQLKIIPVLFSLNALRYLYKINNKVSIIDDIKKNRLFLEYEDFINEKINELSGEEGMIYYTLNNIDDINYATLEEMIENLKNAETDEVKLTRKK